MLTKLACSMSDSYSEESYSLMTSPRNYFLWLSVVHHGGVNLVLNVLLYLTSTSYDEWSNMS